MSLAAVLSAMRELILDGGEIPLTEDARRENYRGRFSGLATEELEDLARISPDKFQVYTRTIFAGERSNLRNHFAMTFALMSKVIGKFDSFQMVQDLHQKRPWKSNLTVSLLENFIQYLAQDRRDISDRIPGLIEVAEFELASLMLSRAADEDVPDDVLAISEIQSLTVGELLQCRFQLPKLLCLKSFPFAVLELRNDFYENDRQLSSAVVAPKNEFLVGSRDKENDVRWLEIPEALFEYLSRVKRQEAYSLADLAEVFADDATGATEIELFSQFSAFLFAFLERQALFILAAE